MVVSAVTEKQGCSVALGEAIELQRQHLSPERKRESVRERGEEMGETGRERERWRDAAVTWRTGQGRQADEPGDSQDYLLPSYL